MVALIRYAVYSPVKGIFLGFIGGQPVWSKTTSELKGDELAPTFLGKDDMAAFMRRNGIEVIPVDCSLFECWPRYGTEAGIEELANAGLPRWDGKK